VTSYSIQTTSVVEIPTTVNVMDATSTSVDVVEVGLIGPQGSVGAQGLTGATGPKGDTGAAGQGVPIGGTANQVLTKIDGTNYNTKWSDPTGIVNVKNYGAKGDGSTDDTTAIQNAIASNNNVYFPSGIYIVSASLTINKSNFSLSGAGIDNTIIKAKNSTLNNWTIIDFRTSGSDYSNVQFSNFTIDGNQSNRTGFSGGNGIMVLCASANIISNTVIDGIKVLNNSNSGILLQGYGNGIEDSYKIEQTLIKNCQIVNNSGVGLSQFKTNNSTIVDNVFSNSGLENLTIDVSSNNHIVDGNRFFKHLGGTGNIGIDSGNCLVFSNNYIDNENNSSATSGNRNGISFNSQYKKSNDVSVSGNVILNCLNYGINFANNVGNSFGTVNGFSFNGDIVGSAIVSGNVISNSGVKDIYIGATSEVVVVKTNKFNTYALQTPSSNIKIFQDENLSVQDGTTSQKGAVQLSDSVSTTDSTKAATPTAVKSANDNANNKVASVSGTSPISVSTGTTPTVSIAAASTTVAGAVQLTDSISSTSTTTAATPNSVKTTYDQLANKAGLAVANTFTQGQTVSSTGNASLTLNSGTSGAPGNQVSFVDMKLDGVLKGNIAINEGTTGTPLEINSAATTDVALVTGGGNVGIGTNAPTAKLDVNGTVKATLLSGPLTGNVTGNVSGSSGSTTGNAATVTNGVYTTDTGTVTSTMILNGTILDADINASAAIAASKISGLVPQTPPNNTWIGSGGRTSTTGDQTNINGTLRIVPFWITTARTLDAVAVLIGSGGTGSSGALARVGIWNADANGAPSTLVRDCSTVALTGTAGTVAQISSLAQSLPAGGYWIGVAIQGAPVTLPYMVTNNTPIFSPYSYSFQATSTTAAATDFLGNNTYRAIGVTGAFASTVPSFTYNSDNISPIKVIWKFSA